MKRGRLIFIYCYITTIFPIQNKSGIYVYKIYNLKSYKSLVQIKNIINNYHYNYYYIKVLFCIDLYFLLNYYNNKYDFNRHNKYLNTYIN